MVLLVVSVMFSLIAVSTTPQPPFQYRSPMTQLLWPAFWSGSLSLEHTSMLAPFDADSPGAHGAFNLGQLVGLRGLASSLPLQGIWVLAAYIWLTMRKREREILSIVGHEGLAHRLNRPS